MPRYEDTETQILGEVLEPDRLRDAISKAIAKAALSASSAKVPRRVTYLEPVPQEELEGRPHLPADRREAVARLPHESGYVPPGPPTPAPTPKYRERAEVPELPPPPPGYVPPEPSWTEAVEDAIRGVAQQLLSALPPWKEVTGRVAEATEPLEEVWKLGVEQRLNPVDSLRMRLGGALGLWPTQGELEQEMQSRAGVSIPAQQWLKENTGYYQSEPGEAQFTYPYGGVHIGASAAPRDKLMRAALGEPNQPIVTISSGDPEIYAHEALHAWFDQTMREDPARLSRFVSRAYEVAKMDPLTLPTGQQDAMRALKLWQRLAGRDPYFGSATELHSYLGQTAWQRGLDAIPEPLREFYADFYAVG